MPLDPIIRAYRDADLTACRALWSALTEHHRAIYGDPEIGGDDPGRFFDQYTSNEQLQGPWVATVSDQVIGLIGLIIEGDEATVEPVIVAADHRSTGIGSALVRFAVDRAKELEVRFLNVRPVARNVQAIEFFIEAGFNLIGQIELFQDLSPTSQREWRPGCDVHGTSRRY